MDELSEALSKLDLVVHENKSAEDIPGILKSLNGNLTAEGTNKKANVDYLVDHKIVETLCTILEDRKFYPASTPALVAEILAEIAKIDSGRTHCSISKIINFLLELLSDNDSDVVLQACRALGNICYDNDAARSLVKQYDGVKHLIKLLKTLLQKEDPPSNMRTITSGCLLNLADTYEEIQEQALEAGILDVLLEYLLKFSTDEDVVTHCLLVLSCLADSSNGRTKILEESVLTKLLSLLEKPLNDDIMDSLLELFGNLCENDVAKLSLAEMGLCEKLVAIVNKHIGRGGIINGTFNICKTVPDLIILILTGDASMQYLWSDGKGVVYKETLKWLKSNDENLLIAGALAAGNFARKDSHCIQMLKDGVVRELKLLLEKHSGRDGDIRMQHAVLSALRNLAIPTQNKSAMVELGVVEKLIDMMSVETFPVVFKLLGTLRMLLDKQENVATMVGKNFEFIKRLVKWCNVDDHPGVKGEATRLLAWIAKNSKDPSVLKNLLEATALPPIISMLKSEHDVMKNEALLAVTLVASYYLSNLEVISSSTDLIPHLDYILKSEPSPEILGNILSLLVIVTRSENLKTQIKTAMCSDLKKLKEHPNENVKELSSKLLKDLEAISAP